MSELAAAGAALLAPVHEEEFSKDVDTSLEEENNLANSIIEAQELCSRRHLAEPENDSISSSEDELDDFDVDKKAKTLPPKIVLKQNGISSLKRSFTLPRNPLFNLTNINNKKAKKNGMKEGIEVPTSPNKAVAKAASVRNLFNRIVTQVSSASTISRSRKNGSNKYEVSEERIAAWKRKFLAEDRVPGVVGIRNHGNTCFINAILQCLSYTDILAEYFVLDTYKGDLKRKNRLQTLTALHKRRAAADFCGRGEVTEQLATMLKSLWSLQYDPEISIRFKSLVEKHASQYKGGSQHDAQEFLLWLLDQVHEDLNVAPRRRYRRHKSPVNGERPSDEVLAAEALSNYMRCNNSFVMDVFQAQFRSSLTCPTCEKQSNTFDPFLCVSLPIPQKQLIPVYVTVLYIDQSPRQVKLGLTIGVHETIGDLRTMLSKDTGIERSQILLTEIDDLTFRRTFKDSELVTVINDKASDTCSLYCVEVLKHREATEDDGAYVLLTWVNVLKEGPIEKRFGSPYTIQVSRETLYTDLQKLLMKEMACILHDDILISNQKVPLFNIRILDGLKGNNYLDSNVDLPMYTLAIEQAVNLCSVDEIVPHVKLTLEWDAPAKSQIISDDRDVIEEHASVKQVAKSPEEATSVTLQECFSLYTKAEKLGDTNAWFCPECKRKQEVVKRMGLWSLPDVLIIHLKRFRQTDNASNKLSTLVEFPLEGCDMSPFVTTRNEQPLEQPPAQQPPMEQPVHNVWSNVLSSFKKDKSTAPEQSPVQPQKACFVYDLYAVCNHHGDDLQGGHYTATCRNPTDGQWYAFDDVNTSKVEEPEVVTDDAYILFYQRQSTTPNSSSASSSASSSSSSAQEHWVYRMPDFNYKGKNGMPLTKSQQQQANIKAATSGFSRNTGKYATMPTSTTTAVKAADESTTAETTADKCDKEQPHSDGEEPREEEELCSDQELPPAQEEVVKEEQEGKSSTTKAEAGTEAATEDVSRPIDKNDVD